MDQRGAGRSGLIINPFLANCQFNDNLPEEFYRTKTWDIITENQISADSDIEMITALGKFTDSLDIYNYYK
jgi:hypothetical protein